MKDFFKNIFNKNKLNNIVKNENITELMYPISRPEPTQFFIDVRQLVGYWLQQEIDKLDGAHWLKTNLTYPSFEHLSIAYKNQIFCILIDIINAKTGKKYLPEQYKQNLIKECLENNLIPCIYNVFVDNPITPAYNTLKPVSNGWNLYHAVTEEAISPDILASEQLVLMSKWELHDFAIQIVRDYIVNNMKCTLLSYQNLLTIEPQLWFKDRDGNKKWVIVRYAMYPQKQAQIPDNITSIKSICNGYNGFFANVCFCSQGIDKTILYRGDGAYIKFEGLLEI